jgi:hypothetical protein
VDFLASGTVRNEFLLFIFKLFGNKTTILEQLLSRCQKVILEISEVKENKNTTHQNLWVVEKAVLEESLS